MNAILFPLAQQGPSVTGAASVPPWKLDDLKDLSPGGICETGYGNQNNTQKTLQYLSTIKHKEKYTTYLGWGVALIPTLLDVLPDILFNEKGHTPLRDIPIRAYAIIKNKLGNISAEQLGFLLSIIPLYYNARAIKNSLWTGAGLDPSGHTMFKMSQYGMMLSIATDHGKKSSINLPTTYYIAFTVIADAIMLANTFTNCHTLAEVVIGGGIGAAILLNAYLISQYTPLGRWVQRITSVANGVIGGLVSSLGNSQVKSPTQLMA